MDTLIALISTADRLQSNDGELDQFFNLKKLDNTALLRINDTSRLTSFDNRTLHVMSDCTKLTSDELSSTWIVDTCEKTFVLLKKLLSHPRSPLSLEEFKSIPFRQFSIYVRRCCLGLMLIQRTNTDTEFIRVLLDQMESVNYGSYIMGGNTDLFEINPLLHCCVGDMFDLVKLLINQYGADIEYVGSNGMTAIMYSVMIGHLEITTYLYQKGAQLETKTHDIDRYARDSIKPLIKKWKKEIQIKKDVNKSELESLKLIEHNYEKIKSEFEKVKLENDLIKLDNERIKSENDLMKRNCENILNLIQNK